MVVIFLYNNTFQLMLMDKIKLTPLILNYILQEYSSKKVEYRCFMFLYFISQRIRNSKVVVIKYNLNCMRNITEKFIISKKVTY